MTKKKVQHYIWRNYLKPWVEGGHIWCNSNGKIEQKGLKKIGQELYFYKLKEMSQSDIEWIKNFIHLSNNPSLKKTNEGWINMFKGVFDIKASLKANGIIDTEFEKELDVLEANLEESFHSKIESESIKYLNSILAGDTSFFKNNSDCIAFLHYLSLQYMRTNNMQKRQCNQFMQVGNENIVSMWPVLRHVFSLNIASSIYGERDKHRLVLLKNNSGIQFITGDQPVINTYSVDGNGTDGLEFYYPVSPNLAVLLTEKDEYKAVADSIDVDDSQAKWFNQAIADLSDEQTYAFSKESLIEFKKKARAAS